MSRGNPDIDRSALDHFGIGAAVDQRHHPLAAQALGQTPRHDVVFLVVGHRDEEVHFANVFLNEQFLVCGVAEQHQCLVELPGNEFGAPLAPRSP